MKSIFLAALVGLFGVSAYAGTTILCAEGEWSVTVNVDDQFSTMASSSYVVEKNSKVVYESVFEKIAEGFEGDFLNSYLWGFEAENGDVVGAAVPGLKEPKPGLYDGFADLLLETPEGDFDGSSVPCVVEIK